MSRSQGMSTKRLQTGCFVVSTELGILGQLGAFGQDRMEKVFYFIAVSCPKAKACRQKTPSWVFCCIDRARYFWGSWVFFWVVFHFIVVPCCPMSPKAKGCRQKDSKLGILLCRQSLVFLGAAGYCRVGWKIFSIL